MRLTGRLVPGRVTRYLVGSPGLIPEASTEPVATTAHMASPLTGAMGGPLSTGDAWGLSAGAAGEGDADLGLNLEGEHGTWRVRWGTGLGI